MPVTTPHWERKRKAVPLWVACLAVLAFALLVAAVALPWVYPIAVRSGRVSYTVDAVRDTSPGTDEWFSEYELMGRGIIGHVRIMRLGTLEWRFFVNWPMNARRPRWFN